MTASPTFGESAFDCPSCTAYASMSFSQVTNVDGNGQAIFTSTCARCDATAAWLRENGVEGGRLIWPRQRGGIPPHREMPQDARQLYEEARDVAHLSPRAGVALLRVALDVLLREVVKDADGRSLNDVIKLAVAQGLTPAVWAAMDALRVIGNDAVHPKQLVLGEEDADAKITALCRLLNLVVEQMISAPRLAQEVFDTLPPSAKDGIARRSGGLPGD